MLKEPIHYLIHETLSIKNVNQILDLWQVYITIKLCIILRRNSSGCQRIICLLSLQSTLDIANLHSAEPILCCSLYYYLKYK